MPFNMAHQGLNDLEIQTAIYQVLSALCPELASPTTTLSSARTALNNAHMLAESVAIASNPLHNLQCQLFFGNGSGRPTSCVHKVLKVGFISTNFFDHSIGRILVELLVYLNQQRVVQRGEVNYALKIYVITLDRRIPFDTKVHYNGTHLEFEDLDVSTMREDAITRILRQQMKENYIRIPENIHTARKVLEAMQLDMLIFTDVGMDFSTYQLAFSRHAPIQVNL